MISYDSNSTKNAVISVSDNYSNSSTSDVHTIDSITISSHNTIHDDNNPEIQLLYQEIIHLLKLLF